MRKSNSDLDRKNKMLIDMLWKISRIQINLRCRTYVLNCFRTRRKTSLRVLFVAPVVCPPAGLSSPLTDSVLISGVEIGGDRDELFSGVGTSDAFNPDDIIVIGGCRPRICLRSISGDVFVLFKVPFV